jgi:hypothetical protein
MLNQNQSNNQFVCFLKTPKQNKQMKRKPRKIATKYSGNLRHYEKVKSKNSRNKRRKSNRLKAQKIFLTKSEEKKMPIEGARKTQQSEHHHHHHHHPKKNIRSCKGQGPSHIKGRPIRITSGFSERP